MRAHQYARIGDYAAIGDGRTVALVARDGGIDWLCLPNLDSPSLFAAILDSRRGGRFELHPDVSYEAERRYVPDTNVLETTFRTAAGVVRLTDAMTVSDLNLAPERELVRRIEGLSGRVPMRWAIHPRFGYGTSSTRISQRMGVPVATCGDGAIAVCSWKAGEPECNSESISARWEVVAEGAHALIVLSAAHQEPLVFPARRDVEARLAETANFWRTWLARRTYEGPWRDSLLRSSLALKLLVFAPSGAIAAAATTSLPESIGGERNWDYRFCWLRDSAFTLDAFLKLGCPAEARAFFWWLMHASQLSHPQLQVLYRLDGGAPAPESTLDLEGYCGSRPVRVGNAAAAQRQLDVYGELLQTAWLYSSAGNHLDAEIGRRLLGIADFVCRIWRQPDSGIWEVRSAPMHFTQSKMMCWVALDRVLKLVHAGQVPGTRAERWRREAQTIRAFVEENCWSDTLQSYVRFAGGQELDASLLLPIVLGYNSAQDPRALSTIAAIERELGDGVLLYRYTGEDGLSGSEGFFLICSFWLVDALARCGRLEQAAQKMEELLGLANDVGLYAEEVEPGTKELLGNFPQGLVHLALINATISIAEAQKR